jgi:two-component system, sensor histidine kinase YesM
MRNAGGLIRATLVNSRLSARLLAFNLLAGTLPLVCVGLLAVQKMDGLVRREVQSSRDQVTALYAASVGYKLSLYSTLLFNLSSSPNVSGPLREPASAGDAVEAGRLVTEEISSQLGARDIKELRNVVVYSFRDDAPAIGSRVSTLAMARGESWFPQMKKGGLADEVFINRAAAAKRDILCLIKPIPDLSAATGTKLGFIKLDLDITALLHPAGSETGMDNDEVAVLDGNGEVVFNEGRFAERCPGYTALGGGAGLETRVRGALRGDVLVSLSPIGSAGWVAVVFFNSKGISRQSEGIGGMLLGLIFVSALVLTGMLLFLAKNLSYRLARLIAKIERVEGGELAPGEPLGGNDELASLDRHFDRMVGRLSEAIKSNYLERLERQQAQLDALQFQVNPHFLYNTLESMNAIAIARGCPEIGEISQRLGAMFRYNVGTGSKDEVLLRQELEQVENYMAIQRIRFSGRFELFVDVDAALAQYPVHKFILQPLAENAVIHGLEPREGRGVIEIRASEKAEGIAIAVADDGAGIVADRLERLRAELGDAGSAFTAQAGIGLLNVHKRLRLFYGPPYGLSIESAAGRGTVVTLLLPAPRGA